MHCIVKQPIHDAQGKLWAYEIIYSNASVADNSATGDAEAAAALQSLLLQCNTDSFLEGKVAFVTFTENLLRREMPKIFSPDALILQIDHDFLLLPDALQHAEMISAIHLILSVLIPTACAACWFSPVT